MNADAFRSFFTYHIAENRKLWDQYIVPLPQDLFVQPVAYSVGSIRDQIVHMVNVEDAWFSDLLGTANPRPARDPADYAERDKLRQAWNAVEADMMDYLTVLQDDMLFTRPLSGEDANLLLWQILLHIANHGTDHRAQILRLLHDVGVRTGPQDYVFYAYDNPLP